MLKLEGKWLVAVSTGPDSMFLLEQCRNLGMDIQIAHVNYHHRKQAEQEEAFIRSYAKEYNIPLHVLNDPFDPLGNFEAEARLWRYTFFAKIVKEEKLNGVLVAHHQDDFIETFLMQEEKGLEPEYFGLKERSLMHGVLLVRPLLSITKAEIIQYLEEQRIPYFIDHTNLENEYRRNQIRHEVIDYLDESTRKALLYEIEKKNAVLQERRCRMHAYFLDGKIKREIYQAQSIEDRLEGLRYLVDLDKHHSKEHLLQLDQLVLSKKDFFVKIDQVYLTTDFEYLFIVKFEPYCYTFEKVVEAEYPYFQIQRGELGVNAVSLKDTDFPITIRNYQEGDWIQMRFGKKKVSRFFIDRKIPLYVRKSWPVVLNQSGNVILVPGLGCDIDHFSINPSINVIQYISNKESLCGKKRQ